MPATGAYAAGACVESVGDTRANLKSSPTMTPTHSIYGQRGDSAYMSPTESLLPDAQGTQQSQNSNGSVGITRNLSRELALAKQKTLELSPSAGFRDSPSRDDTPDLPKASHVPQVAPASGATPPKETEEKDAMWWRPPIMHESAFSTYKLLTQ